TKLKIKRVYYPPEKEDGYRILVDNLWPRGLKKEEAHMDLWLREAAPSTDLRKWFHHEPQKWHEFQTLYWKELKHKPDALESIVKKAFTSNVTLLYAAKDEDCNHAKA